MAEEMEDEKKKEKITNAFRILIPYSMNLDENERQNKNQFK
jgi:hypothetical protein